MNSHERLKEYISSDAAYQEYLGGKMQPSDFEKFCIQHCKDIEEMLNENQELKKQLSNSHQMKNQQKVFIQWLEKEIQRQEDYAVSLGLTIDYDIAEYTSGKIDALKESLSKYKEIIRGRNGN